MIFAREFVKLRFSAKINKIFRPAALRGGWNVGGSL
jgi:hypothetical protein